MPAKSGRMSRRKRQTLWEAVWAGLKSRPSLASVLVLTLALCVRTPFGLLEVRAHELAALIFPVAGTIVALALTAAGLSSTFIVKLSDQMNEVYDDKKFNKEDRGQAVIKRAKALKAGLLPAWHGSVFVLCSFILSALALVAPATEFRIAAGRVALMFDALFAGSALGCLLVGSLWFLPTVRFSFRADLLEQVIRAGEALRGHSAPTVGDLFRRARVLKSRDREATYQEIGSELCEEYTGRPFPPADKVTIGGADARGPIEEYTSGLALVERGIQTRDWGEICRGVVLSLEQIENYEKQRGVRVNFDEWHDRLDGIRGATEAGVSKWLPEELNNAAAEGRGESVGR